MTQTTTPSTQSNLSASPLARVQSQPSPSALTAALHELGLAHLEVFKLDGPARMAAVKAIRGTHLPLLVQQMLESVVVGDVASALVLLTTFPTAFTPEALATYRHMSGDELALCLPAIDDEDVIDLPLEAYGIRFADDSSGAKH